jgi:DNA polymerase-3 subunit gamma/tau
MAPLLAGIPDHQIAGYEDHANRLGTAAMVRAMEVLGEALVDMREALDARVTLEIALVRLCVPAADTSTAAIVERLEALERRVSGGGGVPARPSGEAAGPGSPTRSGGPAPAPRDPAPPPPPEPAGSVPASAPVSAPPGSPAPASSPPPSSPRPTIGAMRQLAPDPVSSPVPRPADPEPAAVAATVDVDRDELTRVWGDQIFPAMSPGVRSLYRMGRWTAVVGGEAVFALPTAQYRERAEQKRLEVEAALAARFGGRIAIRLEVDDAPPVAAAAPGRGSGGSGRSSEPSPRPQRAPARSAPERGDSPGAEASPYDGPLPSGPPDDYDDDEPSAAEFADLDLAPSAPASAEARLMEAFPGTEEVIG